MRRRKRISDEVSFQITPMIDMTFLLLIFFMITSKLSKEQVKIDIALPTAASAIVPDDLSNRDIINIDGDGVYYIGNTAASKEEVAEHLRRQFKNFPPLRVYIRADRRTPARKIKDVMRMCSEAGALDIIIGSYRRD